MDREVISQEDMMFPVPMKVLPTDEVTPPYQTEHLLRVQQETIRIADVYSRKQGLSRREFLTTSCGMAAAFMAVNAVSGDFFRVSSAEAADPVAAEKRKQGLSSQFIFDVQTHFVSPNYTEEWLLGLREQAKTWGAELKDGRPKLEDIRFANFYKEVYQLSDTDVALLSSAPNDDPKKWFIHNNEMAEARNTINRKAGRKVLYCHAVFTPGQPGWMEELDRAISEYKPDAWKGYTTGAPFDLSKYPWRLDDEKLVYPAYEKMVKAGIVNVCIHKGLLPANYREKMPTNWRYGLVDDLAKAARDWPQLNFIIYHSAIQSGDGPSQDNIKQFEHSGYIPWVSDLARMPENNVNNVYAELGAVFATTAISAPKYCAAILGTLIKGLGPDRVLWGTDSVFFGSPQWQIEALRRLEIPGELQRKYGFRPLGAADGEVKNMIFGLNAAKLYGIKL